MRLRDGLLLLSFSAGSVPVPLAAPAPSTPLGSFEDGAVSWASRTTLMAFVGLAALAFLVAGPAHGLAAQGSTTVRTRLSWSAAAAGLLASVAVLTDLAHAASDDGYAYGAAWGSLFDGSVRGLLNGFEAALPLAGAVLFVGGALRLAACRRVAAQLGARVRRRHSGEHQVPVQGARRLGSRQLRHLHVVHGSARNQAFQADAAKHATGSVTKLPTLPAKQATAATWIEGTAETAAALSIMVAGYRFSGRLARRRIAAATDGASAAATDGATRAVSGTEVTTEPETLPV